MTTALAEKEISYTGIASSATVETRYPFIEALRGLGALSVLFNHLIYGCFFYAALRPALPDSFFKVVSHCACVQVFFVMSGFVIAHSLFKTNLRAKGVCRFILRRQIRLDPTYWTVLFITLMLQRSDLVFPEIASGPMPGCQIILSNLFYLQGVLRNPQIVQVAWSLCIELQFYLTFILFLVLGNWGRQTLAPTMFSKTVVIGFGLLSLLARTQPQLSDLRAWLVFYWVYFAAGILCYWYYKRVVGLLPMVSFFIVFAACSLGLHSIEMCIGLASAGLILVAAERGGLQNWLTQPILQYLGKISYSFYLIHWPIAFSVARFGHRLTGDNLFWGVVWLITAAAIAMIFAHIIYVLIEQPSMRLAAKFK